jgi:hypothetical protein
MSMVFPIFQTVEAPAVKSVTVMTRDMEVSLEAPGHMRPILRILKMTTLMS